MARQWMSEASDRRYDPESGALITHITSSAASSINIYCEQPYTSPAGNRIAILRRNDISFDDSWRLIVGDLRTLRVTLIEASGVVGVCNAAWSGILHYTTAEGKMFRLDMDSLEKEEIRLPKDTQIIGRGASVSPDQRYIVYSKYVEGPQVAIVLVDLEDQREKMIFQHPEITNPHLQFNPVHGKEILVQHNRGSRLTKDRGIERPVGPEGTTHFVLSLDGTRQAQLPAGPPHTGSSTGHSNWIADTGLVAWTAHWEQSDWTLGPLNPGGNLFYAAPGDEEPKVFPAPEERFNHINVSKCGKYFVCDSRPGSLYDEHGELRPHSIVIGCFETGKYRTLVRDSRSSGGGGQHQHPHAYLTADNRNVIFNADPFGGPTQVVAARIPDGFLESLD